MRGRKITDRGTTFVFRGYQARDLAHAAGVRVLFNGVAGGHVGDSSRLPQLLAYLDSRRVGYAFEREESPAAATPPVTPTADEDEPPLFGGVE